MGWVTDKGKDAVQKFSNGGTVDEYDETEIPKPPTDKLKGKSKKQKQNRIAQNDLEKRRNDIRERTKFKRRARGKRKRVSKKGKGISDKKLINKLNKPSFLTASDATKVDLKK